MNWTTTNIPDQHSRTALVTGANSGIGYEIALALYKKGAHLIIAARDLAMAEKAAKDLKSSGGCGSTEIEQLDLSSQSQIREFSSRIESRHQRIDLLFNNAGVMTPPEGKTEEGYELQFGVNFLGHFLLTGLLYPLLKNGTDSRIITMSSGAHKSAERIDFNNLRIETSYNPDREYAISKLACLQFMVELKKRIEINGDKIISTAAHPGVTQSQLARHMDQEKYSQAIEKFGNLMPTWQGALPALYAATAKQVQGGDYFGPDGLNELKGYPGHAEISVAARDDSSCERLWEYAQFATAITYP